LPFLQEFDYLLVMSVYPGSRTGVYPDALPKVRTAREYIVKHGLKTQIAIDGGIDSTNAAEVVAAGADILVMGSAFFGANDRAALVKMVTALK